MTTKAYLRSTEWLSGINVVAERLILNSFAPAKIVKKNVRKVVVRKTVIINHNYVPQVCL